MELTSEIRRLKKQKNILILAQRKEAGSKVVIAAPVLEDNSCACSECAYMKKNTLEKLYSCLLYSHPEIKIEESLRVKALRPINRMLEISKELTCQQQTY